MKDNLKTQEHKKALPILLEISKELEFLIKQIEENKDLDPRPFIEKYLSQFDTKKQINNIAKKHLIALATEISGGSK